MPKDVCCLSTGDARLYERGQLKLICRLGRHIHIQRKEADSLVKDYAARWVDEERGILTKLPLLGWAGLAGGKMIPLSQSRWRFKDTNWHCRFTERQNRETR